MVALLPTEHTWLWGTADAIVAAMVIAYASMLGVLAARRLYASVRAGQDGRARARLELLLDELEREPGGDRTRLRLRVRRLGERERPIAAEVLLERLAAAPEPQRRALAAAVEEIGGVEVMLRGLRRFMPWRRALAAQVLGRCEARVAVPALVERLDDASRLVREAAVLALGRIGDTRALPILADLWLRDSARVASGVLFEALLGFPRADAGRVFAGALGSPDPRIRAQACHGTALTLEPEQALPPLARALADAAATVRAAAAEALGRIGGEALPEELAAAARDEAAAVRRAAVRALAAFDDPGAVALARAALDDPDRDAAVRAGDALVRLSRSPRAAPEAQAALAECTQWTVRRALVLAEIGAR